MKCSLAVPAEGGLRFDVQVTTEERSPFHLDGRQATGYRQHRLRHRLRRSEGDWVSGSRFKVQKFEHATTEPQSRPSFRCLSKRRANPVKSL
jgi:hypothetical protein